MSSSSRGLPEWLEDWRRPIPAAYVVAALGIQLLATFAMIFMAIILARCWDKHRRERQLRHIRLCSYSVSPGAAWPEQPESCGICLEDFVKREVVRVLPGCKHVYHKDCFDPWLLGWSASCPLCRAPVVFSDSARQDEITDGAAGRCQGELIT